MSPSETSLQPELLEHPAEAFAYYRNQGVPQVVCEQKHMGSRAIVVLCRDQESVQNRFGVVGEGIGICYTRTGRRFFSDASLEAAFLERIHLAVSKAGWWERFNTTWVCLDCELMPWSVKAQELVQQQYAAVGAAAEAGLNESLAVLQMAALQNHDVFPLVASYQQRLKMVEQYVIAYQNYCWTVNELSDLKLAPFHLLATEEGVHTDKNHLWHMETLGQFCQYDGGLLLATPYRVVDVTDPASCELGIQWWQEVTANGGEGMVIKPLDFISKNRKGLIQPAIKSRGQEYLRIIYGAEYTIPENLQRLRSRGLSAKRSLALREFALGLEALERFSRYEPLHRVHECVFGVLALESEPIDPRL